MPGLRITCGLRYPFEIVDYHIIVLFPPTASFLSSPILLSSSFFSSYSSIILFLVFFSVFRLHHPCFVVLCLVPHCPNTVLTRQ